MGASSKPGAVQPFFSGGITAALFGVPADVLLGVATAAAGKRGPTPRLERLSRLPKAQQQTVHAMLDDVLQQA